MFSIAGMRRATVAALLFLATGYGASSVARNVPYVAAFAPLNSNAHPYSGTMRLNFNQGVISGTYTDTSVKPGGPLANRINAPVTGGLSANNYLHFAIGALSFRGTLNGEWIKGTATYHGRSYTFEARQGVPGGGT